MIKYTLDIDNAQRQYIQFTGEFDHDESSHASFQLPAWRPGRYELGNFAKNVRNFRVTDASGTELTSFKSSKDKWQVDAKGCTKLIISYEYYSTDLNAGSTYLDEQLLYVNPVNCFMYRPSREEVDSFHVQLNVPKSYQLASPLTSPDKHEFVARNVHELLDSPFICSDQLKHHSFVISSCTFHIWINGNNPIDFSKIEADFIPFCKAQLRDFKSIPVDDYLFLFHFLEENSYHGVEHEKCTVITLGPSQKLLTPAFYEELLGVSSHELYHTWNVKALRPNDMLPYDYTKENYSQLGYVYEGVTTYMGDWYLLNSGVFDFDTYSRHLGSYLTRHFQNYGRFNYSVADSSYDTWLDGYVTGAPGRKTSIYTEGCLIAFISDLMILKATNGKSNLASVMTQLWSRYGETGVGYTAENYFSILEEVSGVSFSNIREQLIHGTEDFKPFLENLLPHFGLELSFSENKNIITQNLGIKLGATTSGTLKIVDIEPNSPSDINGIHIGDFITSINGDSENLKDELSTIDFSKEVTLEIKHRGNSSKISLSPKKDLYFPKVSLSILEPLSESQRVLFNHWHGDN